jgi:hypothetical protein
MMIERHFISWYGLSQIIGFCIVSFNWKSLDNLFTNIFFSLNEKNKNKIRKHLIMFLAIEWYEV